MLSALAAGIIAVSVFAAYTLGQKQVRDRYEIWYSSSATFESRLVDASQMAMALETMHDDDMDGAKHLLLSRIKNDLDVIHALLPLAPERDRAMANGVITGISEKIGDLLPETSVVNSDYLTALQQSTAVNVKRQLEHFTKTQTNHTDSVIP